MTPGKLSRLLAILASTAVSLSSASLAQHPVPAAIPRIVEAVNESQLAALKGDTRPEARAENDRGRVPASLPMTDLVLVLRRSPERQAAFEAMLNALQDPASPQFHHWLTPDQIGRQYGPADSDIATIRQFLLNHGLRVDSVSKDRLTVTFSGTAGQVEAALHTEIHNLQVNNEAHIANMSDPQIPAALTPVVVGVKALHNFFPRPQHKVGSLVRRNADGTWDRIGKPEAATSPAKAVPAAANARQIAPKFDGGAGIEDIGPYDFATIYNVLPLWNASTPIDGTGQKIAIAGTSKIVASDVTTFRSAFGLPTIPSFSQVVANGTDPGICTAPSGTAACTVDDEYENTLDVEWSGAVAKGSGIVLVVSGNNSATTDTVYTSAKYIIDNNVAPILNVSYGECELALGTSGNKAYSDLWSTAYAAGIAVFVSSGDQGSAVCDAGGSSQLGNPYGAQFGLTVSGLSSTPYNVSVGGTDFDWGWVTNGQTNFWNTTSDSHKANAKGYIPEFPWNSTCANSEYVAYVNQQLTKNYSAAEVCDLIGTQQITSSSGSLTFLVDTVGGSGGKSTCTTNSTTSTSTSIDPTSCSGGYAKPSWQTGVTGIPADGKRDVPDVSLFAASGFSGSAYVVCVSSSGAGCTYTPGTEPTGQEVGGTSVSSPAMAGVMALINQKVGSIQGNPNPVLYKIAANETYSGCVSNSVPLTGSACVFNDITTGTIAVPCVVGAPDCTGTSQTPNTYGLLNGFASTAGFDLATGLGSVNVANLVNAYAAALAPAVTLSPTSLTFPLTVLGASSASQSVTLTNSGTADLTISSISFGGTNATSFSGTEACGTTLVAGASCVITVTFTPDTVGSLTASIDVADNASGSPQSVTLKGVGEAPGAFTLSAGTVTAAPGSGGTSTITATGTGGYFGAITLNSCVLATSPSGAVDAPACAIGTSPITIAAGSTTGTGTVTFTTTAATASLRPEQQNNSHPGRWAGGGGLVLAALLFFGIPARSKKWRSIVGVFVCMLALGVLSGCGGGGGSGGGNKNPGTTAGTYTYTVTGTDAAGVKQTVTVTLTVS